MGFRLGVSVGLAAGYVLGARAGRERYEQIRSAAEVFAGSQTAQHLESGLRNAWESAKEEFPDQAGTVLDLHDRLDGRGRP